MVCVSFVLREACYGVCFLCAVDNSLMSVRCPGPPLKMPVSRSSPQDASVQVLPSRCQCPGPPLKMPVSRSSPQDASVQVLPSRCT